MDNYTIALFGEAGKGELKTAYYCRSLTELEEYLGNPPPHSKGLFFAVQALLYQRDLIFFRVREEGYSVADYMGGLNLLQSYESPLLLSAIGIPGVANSEILEAIVPICSVHRSILITSESDLYDYLTAA